MKRTHVINAILEKKNRHTSYLEIGVRNGNCFFQINANRRIAVDPEFVIGKRTYFNAYRSQPLKWLKDSFYSLTSDEYFERKAKSKPKATAILIDGLHTYEQSYRDVQSSLNILEEDGVIVMHDCNPKSEAEAFPTDSYESALNSNLPGWRNVWCGDVWKTVLHLQTQPNLEVCVLDTDFGLGLVRKSTKPEPQLVMDVAGIKNLSYADLAANRESWLNLKSKDYLQEFLSRC
ncbi:MAG: class I SAM-dependent methyltransferase [Cyclobacteriaceae bacterium]